MLFSYSVSKGVVLTATWGLLCVLVYSRSDSTMGIAALLRRNNHINIYSKSDVRIQEFIQVIEEQFGCIDSATRNAINWCRGCPFRMTTTVLNEQFDALSDYLDWCVNFCHLRDWISSYIYTYADLDYVSGHKTDLSMKFGWTETQASFRYVVAVNNKCVHSLRSPKLFFLCQHSEYWRVKTLLCFCDKL